MNRRDFFRAPADASSESPAPLPEFRTAERAGSPRQYKKGERVLITSSRAWLCYDAIGFYAVEAYCPHLGCLVRPADDGFACPCHRSRFSVDGERETGLAPRGLRHFYVDLDANGHLVIHRNRIVDPADRLIA